MTTAFIIKIVGLFLGVVARSLIPWLRKLREGEVQGFDHRYIYSALATFILGVVITLVLFPQFKGEAAGGPNFETYFRLFCLAFGFGFGWNAIVLEAGQWANCFLTDESIPTAEKTSDAGDKK
ncbi:MAG: hypothetical protein ACP5J6_10955 [Candidatus Saccharicenans sp.]